MAGTLTTEQLFGGQRTSAPAAPKPAAMPQAQSMAPETAQPTPAAAPRTLSTQELFGQSTSKQPAPAPPAGVDTERGRLRTAAAQFLRGIADVAAGVPKAIGLIESSRAGNVVEVFDSIDRGEITGPDQPGVYTSRAAANRDYLADIETYFGAPPEQRRALRQKYAEISRSPQDTSPYKFGTDIEQKTAEYFPINPRYDDEFWTSTVPQGAGSAVGFVGTGLAGRAVRLPAAATMAGAGASLGGVNQFEEAIRHGASIEDAYDAAGLGAVVGTSEAIPISSLLNRLDKATGGGVKRVIIDAAKQGTEEAIQEAFQSVSDNLIASDLVGYDPSRGLFTGTAESAGAGFTVGALMQTIGAMIMPGRYRRPGAPPPPEEQPAPAPMPALNAPGTPLALPAPTPPQGGRTTYGDGFSTTEEGAQLQIEGPRENDSIYGEGFVTAPTDDAITVEETAGQSFRPETPPTREDLIQRERNAIIAEGVAVLQGEAAPDDITSRPESAGAAPGSVTPPAAQMPGAAAAAGTQEAPVKADETRETEQGVELYEVGRQGQVNTDLEAIARQVLDIFAQIAPKETDLQVFKKIFGRGENMMMSGASSSDRQEIAGAYNPLEDIIRVSLTMADPQSTIRHETLHALKAGGFFTDQEWKLLENDSRKRWKDRYGVPNVEEGVAYAYGDFLQGKPVSALPLVKRAFKRISDFLARVANMLRGMGFQTAEDIFGKIETGQVRDRGRGGGQATGEERFAAVPTPPQNRVAQADEPSDMKLVPREGRAISETEAEKIIAGELKVGSKVHNRPTHDALQPDLRAPEGTAGSRRRSEISDTEGAADDNITIDDDGSKFSLMPNWRSRAERVAKETGVSADDIAKAGGPMWNGPERKKGTSEQERVMAKILAHDDRSAGERIRDGIQSIKENASRHLRQGLVDQFDAIAHYEKSGNAGKLRDAATSAYKATRLTQNLHSVMHVLLKRGMIAYTDGQFVRREGFDGGFEGIFNDIADKGLMRLWAGYAIANRAKRLKAEGRENLLSDSDIQTLLALRREHPEFQVALRKWNRFNNAILDMAEAAGVVDGDTREAWAKNDYVPFFRVIDDSPSGPYNKRGIANQRSGIRQLKGGEAQINDLIENMVMNVTHLVDASFKNVAAKRTLREAKKAGAVESVGMDWTVAHIAPEKATELLEDIGVQVAGLSNEQKQQMLKVFTMRPPKDRDVVSVLVGGKPKYFRVNDPLLLSAMTHMDQRRFDWFTENVMGRAKTLLTRGIVSFPDFMIANAIRDSMAAWVVASGKTNPVAATKGFFSSWRDSASRQTIAAAGGGTAGYYDVTPKDVRKQLDAKYRGGGRNAAVWLWEQWNAIGQASENMNRIAIFEKLRSEGATEAEAAFQAMDIMDFSMRGDWVAVRWLTTVVPFLNARMQGLYRLGRGAMDNPRGFALRGAAISAATMALLAWNWDDERYEELPDWDRDVNYHIWLGNGKYYVIDKQNNSTGQRYDAFAEAVKEARKIGGWVDSDYHLSIPKPFEVGAVFSTLPERLSRFFAGKDDADRFGDAMLTMFGDTFAFNPVPQAVKPLAEQAANKTFFTGSPIESFYQQDILPGYRTRSGTSAMSRELGKAFPETVSPVRMDALLRGYLGTLGVAIMETSNIVEQVVSDVPAPERRIDGMPVIKRFVRTGPAKYTRFLDDFYDLRNEMTQIVRSAKELIKQGDREAAYKLLAENPNAQSFYKVTNRAGKRLSDWSKLQKQIRDDKSLSPAEKRRRMDEIYAARNVLTKNIVDSYTAATQQSQP